jgi:hypothetical protein
VEQAGNAWGYWRAPQASAGTQGNKETLDHLRELIASNQAINQTLERIFTA